MLKAINTMANLIRPAADRRTTTHTRSRSPPHEVAKQAAIQQQQQQPPAAPISTRRPSKALAQPADAPNARDAASPARASARKRSIADVDTPDARPQSKAKQRRSYDDLSTWADDATKKLHGNVDDAPSGASTPKPQDTPAAMADKKSLRSKGSVRKASVLAEIFTPDGYDDILAGFGPVDSAESNASSIGSDDQIALVDEPLTAAQLAAYRETLREKAAQARAKNQTGEPAPHHVYRPLPPEDYSPYARLPAAADPLADGVSRYAKEHKRHEREERKERNLDVERHQFRMSKAPAVLEELEGDDWHKVFVIDKSERKAWEPKRAHVINLLRTALARQDAFRDIELKKRRREKERRKREREGTEDEDESEDEHPKKRPPRHPRPSKPHPSPPPVSPPKRRPPRPQGYILDIPPAPAVPPTPFKSFYRPGQRPAFPNPSTHNSNTNPSTNANPSPRKATRSAAPPPFGVPLPRILTMVDDEVLLEMLKADQEYAREGLPTEEALLEDERSFSVFVLGGEVVQAQFLRENERMRRVRRRTRASGEN
ncbi:something about silencing domain containing-protein [Paraphaeosphaeria sporulosa]